MRDLLKVPPFDILLTTSNTGHTREIGFTNGGGYAEYVWVPHER